MRGRAAFRTSGYGTPNSCEAPAFGAGSAGLLDVVSTVSIEDRPADSVPVEH
jgi:hypothetical protein